MICFSNYKESFINISSFDLKTGRRANLKTYNLSARPTRLFHLDQSHILVGTEGGKIEHWCLDDEASVCRNVTEAHPESDAGISVITELHSQSPLFRQALPEEKGPKDNFRLLVTASAGSNIFKVWKMKVDAKNLEIFPYFQIKTTIPDSIKYFCELTDT